MDHTELARMGGLAALKKLGREHYVKMAKSRKKPISKISDHAVYMRGYRKRKAKELAAAARPKRDR